MGGVTLGAVALCSLGLFYCLGSIAGNQLEAQGTKIVAEAIVKMPQLTSLKYEPTH